MEWPQDHCCHQAALVFVLPKQWGGGMETVLLIWLFCSPFSVLPLWYIINDGMITICEGYSRLSLLLVTNSYENCNLTRAFPVIYKSYETLSLAIPPSVQCSHIHYKKTHCFPNFADTYKYTPTHIHTHTCIHTHAYIICDLKSISSFFWKCWAKFE